LVKVGGVFKHRVLKKKRETISYSLVYSIKSQA
jgi:hypothetical protein